jgi:hypothetical protein
MNGNSRSDSGVQKRFSYNGRKDNVLLQIEKELLLTCIFSDSVTVREMSQPAIFSVSPTFNVRCAASSFQHRERPGMTEQNHDPLHGVTLEQVLNALVEHYEWSGLAERIDIRCFKSDPSIKSSLTFLRKAPWAREKVERLYVKLMRTKRPL